MNLQQLLEAAREWIGHEGSDEDGRVLAAALEGFAGTDAAAALAAATIFLLLWSGEEDYLDVEGLDRALRLYADLPQREQPDLVRRIFAADVQPDVEAAVPGAPCHPVQLAVAAYELSEHLAEDHGPQDVQLLLTTVGLTRLAIDYAQPEGELAADLLALHGDELQRLVGASNQPGPIPHLLAVRRLSLASARPDNDRLDEMREALRWALMLMYAYDGDETHLSELGVHAPVLAAFMRDHVVSLARFGSVGYMTAAIGHAAGTVYLRSGGTALDDFWNVRADEPYRITVVPRGGMIDLDRGGGEPLRVANINLGEATAQHIEEDIAARPPRDRGGRAELLAELSEHHLRRYRERHDRELLDQAVRAATEAVRLCPRHDPRRGRCLLALFRALLARLDADGDPADLDAVIARLREFLALRSVRDPGELARHYADLASYLVGRYEDGGRRPDLDEAMALAARAVRLAPAGSAVAFLARAGLGHATVYAATDGVPGADLDAGIGLLREGAGIPDGDENRPTVLNNLSAALVARYYAGGSVADLDEAAQAARDAWEAMADGHWTRRHESLYALGTAIGLRYREHGAISDLDDAVALARAVLAEVPDGHSFASVARAALARHLAARAGRTGSADEIADAVRLARTAVDEAGSDRHAEHARWTLATVLSTPTGTPGDRARLAEAVAIRRAGPLDRAGRIELARLLQRLWLLDPDAPEHSREAERLLRQARRVGLDKTELHPELGEVLYERARRDGDERTMREAARFLAAVAKRADAAPVDRVNAARRWGAALAAGGDWGGAVAAYRLAVGLLPQLAPRTLLRADQEYRLSHAADLASDAGVAALRAGEPAVAAGLLEAGRGVLWARLMRGDADLARLSARAPGLAGRYADLRDALDEPYTREPLSPESAGRLAERRRLLGAEWRALLARLGEADDPGAPADAVHPGVPGAVALLAAGAHGSYAVLLLPGGGIEPVPLPAAPPGAAADAADRVRDALLALQDPGTGHAGQLRAEAEIGAVLDWLWSAVTGPVLDRLDRIAPAGGPHRLWWVPAGPLAALPIHAAGDALTRACSSFSPTLAALRGTGPAAPAAPRTLVVAMPQTPGAAPLPGAGAEAELLRAGRDPVELIGPDATRAAVVEALAGCDIAHFACHSVADPERPGNARLLLHDHARHPFTLHDVARLRLPGAWLAYLSSCATMLSGRGLADEAVHLAAAFRHAGFANVVGTLWAVDDRLAALPTAASFYARLDALGPAEALRRAAAGLAADRPGNPSFWAGHVHVGR
ncbi:CHAT domain-containing protein [Dactylosporangium sp. CA-139066]|uniref:CHAT domain-containing protein n=1 Tax=Dactylosporangium sp. CA-139066 TaxID=3239930 RepID=UPI003D8C7464